MSVFKFENYLSPSYGNFDVEGDGNCKKTRNEKNLVIFGQNSCAL